MLRLTYKDKEVVRLLLAGYAYKVIADKLNKCEGTIKSRICNIRLKNNIDSKARLVAIYAMEELIRTAEIEHIEDREALEIAYRRLADSPLHNLNKPKQDAPTETRDSGRN